MKIPETKHLKYGGSTMQRTMKCPGWHKMSEGIPSTPAGSAAAEGTLLHHCAEELVALEPHEQPERVEQMLSEAQEFDGVVLTEDLVRDKLEPAMAVVEELFTRYDINTTELSPEPFVELIPERAGGSIDLLAFSEDGETALILDYKFGHNTVHAEDNAQMLFYALCASVDPQFAGQFRRVKTLALAIVQPNDDGDVADVWETPIDVLDDFELAVYDAIDDAESSNPTLNSGPWCRYCPAQSICADKKKLAAASQRLDITKKADLEQALAMVPVMQDWIKAVLSTAHAQAERGEQFEQFKLVNKRAVRQWVDVEELEEKLRKMRRIKFIEEACDVKLKSPAQLEKVFAEKGIKKFDGKELSDYIASVSSGTTLVPRSDKRPETVATAVLTSAVAGLLTD